jgi:hypothetical protein
MRLFTVEEANETLGVVRPLAERLVVVGELLRARQADAAALAARVAGNGGAAAQVLALREAERQATEHARELTRLIDELSALGVQVKDVGLGLVDFPADRGGETVLLCWKVGEDAIRFWHGLEEGYAGRKPLPL